MANLFWKQKGRKTLNLVSVPFVSEEKFERAVFETKGLLQDVYLLKRQVRGGRKSGVPDIIGVDTDGNVCIVEMKNVRVDSTILPQVVQYAFWAESNPDSIKTLWLESTEQPEGVKLSFDNYGVRIIVIAPSIDPSTLNLVGKIDYPIDLIEITRWAEKGTEFLLVNKLVPAVQTKVRPARGLGVYDRPFYESNYNKESVDHFLRYAEEINKFVKKRGWPLELKFNKNYSGFKLGFFNAFGVTWVGTKSFVFFFKIPEKQAQRLAPKSARMEYWHEWKQAVFKIEPGRTRVSSFAPLFKAAYENQTGTK